MIAKVTRRVAATELSRGRQSAAADLVSVASRRHPASLDGEGDGWLADKSRHIRDPIRLVRMVKEVFGYLANKRNLIRHPGKLDRAVTSFSPLAFLARHLAHHPHEADGVEIALHQGLRQKPGRFFKRVAYTTCVALSSLLAGCDLPGKPRREDRPKPADEIVDFNTLFQRNCTGCHGAVGKLGPAPPLNDPVFLAIVPDDELLRVVSEGRPGTPMAAFAEQHGGPLSKAQVKALAEGLKPRFQSSVDVKQPFPPYRSDSKHAAEPSAADVTRGAELFARACAGCHGEGGEGGSAGAVADPAFLALVSDQALRRIIITGRPDLGMPNFADRTGREDDFRPLDSEDIDHLVTFLASRRRPSAVSRNENRAPEKEHHHDR